MAQHVTSLILASEHPALPLITMVSSLSYSDPVVIFVTQLYKKKSNYFYSNPIEFGIRMLQFCNFKSIYCWSSYRLFFLLLFFGFWWGFFFFNYHIELNKAFFLIVTCCYYYYLFHLIRKVIIFIQFPLKLGLECYNFETSSPYIAQAVTDCFWVLFILFYFFSGLLVGFFNFHIELKLSF